MKTKLERFVRRADEVAEDGDVGAVDTDASGIHRETEFFGLFEIDSRVIQFGEAKTLCRQYAVQTRRIDRAGRTVPSPRTPRYLVELLPVAFLPGRHSVNLKISALTLGPLLLNTSSVSRWMLQRPKRFTLARQRHLPPNVLASPANLPDCTEHYAETIRYIQSREPFSSAGVSNTLRGHLLRRGVSGAERTNRASRVHTPYSPAHGSPCLPKAGAGLGAILRKFPVRAKRK